MRRTDYDRFAEEPGRRRALRREELILEVTEAIVEAMARAGVSKSQLAERLGKTRGHVSQLLAGRNLTIGTVAEVADAIGAKVEVRLPARPAPRRAARPVRSVARDVGVAAFHRGGMMGEGRARGGKRKA